MGICLDTGEYLLYILIFITNVKKKIGAQHGTYIRFSLGANIMYIDKHLREDIITYLPNRYIQRSNPAVGTKKNLPRHY